MRKIKLQKGFTLIEVMIAMAIFVTFMGILIGSYTSIVRGQQDSNSYRLMYSEARTIFDLMTNEIRDRAIFYPQNENLQSPATSLSLISKEGKDVLTFCHNEDQLYLTKGDSSAYLPLNSDTVKLTRFEILVSPVVDPYQSKNYSWDAVQFQPRVTILATFEKEIRQNETVKVDFQTTVSSRIYGLSPVIPAFVPTSCEDLTTNLLDPTGFNFRGNFRRNE